MNRSCRFLAIENQVGRLFPAVASPNRDIVLLSGIRFFFIILAKIAFCVSINRSRLAFPLSGTTDCPVTLEYYDGVFHYPQF